MPKRWETPYYDLRSLSGQRIRVDVTSSISAGLDPNSIVTETLVRFLKEQNITAVLDFGAGALRHTFPLLDAGMEVCAVEFKEAFQRPIAREELAKAQKRAGFCALLWPSEFIQDGRRFGAALLSYVLQVMPRAGERELVLKHLHKKLHRDGYLLYMSRYGQVSTTDLEHRVEDGYFRWPGRDLHSFYREFSGEETDALLKKSGFHRLKSLSRGGTEQIFLYGKGRAVFV